jgi:hypothetical protein
MDLKLLRFIFYLYVVGLLFIPTGFAIDEQALLNISQLSPNLDFSPASHDFGNVLQGNIYQTTFEIWNDGTDQLTWTLGTTQTWLGASPMSGSSTGTNDKDIVVVTIYTTGLSCGQYSGVITISSNDDGAVRYYSVEFTVIDNHPPNKPLKLSGPSTGHVGEMLIFTSSTVDPDNGNVQYGIDMDNDGLVEEWSDDFFASGATVMFHIRFTYPGIFNLRVKARDIYGAESMFSDTKKVTIIDNNPPMDPSEPLGPLSGCTGVTYSFSSTATDIDGDEIRYGWDWDGDSFVDEWTKFYPSGSKISLTHTWNTVGTYQIRVKAEDEHGDQSGYSSYLQIAISVNSPPEKPLVPSGDINGRIDVTYTYSTSTSDPDSHRVYYLFDWGDGTDSGWLGPYMSGDVIYESHAWTTKGSYAITVKAKDDPNGDGDISDGIESVWSDPLQISMARSKCLRDYLKIIIPKHLWIKFEGEYGGAAGSDLSPFMIEHK